MFGISVLYPKLYILQCERMTIWITTVRIIRSDLCPGYFDLRQYIITENSGNALNK